MADPHDVGELDDLVTALLTASRVLVGVSARSLASAEDRVTVTQFRTLVILHTRGGSSLSSLAGHLDVQPSTVLRMVDKMVAQGLVVRRHEPRDRRIVIIELTSEGTALVEDVTNRRRDAIEEIVRVMPPPRRQEMIRALSAFAAAAHEPRVTGDTASRLGW